MNICSCTHGRRQGDWQKHKSWIVIGIAFSWHKSPLYLTTYTYLFFFFDAGHLRIPIKVHHPHVQRKRPLRMLCSGCNHLYPRFGPRCCVRTQTNMDHNICKEKTLIDLEPSFSNVDSFKWAIDGQPKAQCMEEPLIQAMAYILFGVGNILVLSSMYVLGVTGTYLGKFFHHEKKPGRVNFEIQTVSFANNMAFGSFNGIRRLLWHSDGGACHFVSFQREREPHVQRNRPDLPRHRHVVSIGSFLKGH